jgi:hypothetical protein
VAHVHPFADGARPRLSDAAGPVGVLDPWAGFPIALGGVQMLSAGLLRRAAFEAVGGLDVRHAGVADMHLWYRLAAERPLLRVHARSAGRRLHAASMSEALRSRGVDFCERQARAARAALCFRRARRGCDALDARLETRCRALEHAVRALRAREHGDLAACRSAASDLERALAGEGTAFAERLFAKLLWSLVPDGPDAQRCRRELLESLLGAWPADAAASTRALRSLLAAQRGPRAPGLLAWARLGFGRARG